MNETKDNGQPEFLTEREVAQKFRVNARTIRRLVARGGFPRPLKIGRCLRYPTSEVLRYLATLQTQPV
jgi:excisionase family DNA binding protein